ncbi:MAG: thiolase family protein [Gammaproteobacteria bacterium]|nr:thiolase family protein [Gammaproteobacteria bacterium]
MSAASLASIPYGAYWSTPFARWQGSFGSLHSLRFAMHVGRHALDKRKIPVDVFDFGVLGTTVPQQGAFYGLPWVMGELGADSVGGPTINQACATGARSLQAAAAEIGQGAATAALVLTADRTSNGPHLYYPAPQGPGGTGVHENWVLDNFERDPLTGLKMIQTAENVASRHGISTSRQNEVTAHRYRQYAEAMSDDAAFLRRFMDLPFEVPNERFTKTVKTLSGDEGIHPTTAEGLAALRPVVEGGTVTFGGQTHPADGSAAIVVTHADRAAQLSSDPAIAIDLIAFGQARVERGYMPEAPVPAAAKALAAAGLKIGDIAAIKTHNPFVVNDIYFADSFGIDPMSMNNFGCSLVWGHPQGPTGLRSVIELIEELVLKGGGYGLFSGCAAGDTGMAVVLRVSDSRR